METDKHILVIDDDDGIRDMLRQVLESDGYVVTEQSTGQDIYNIVQSANPDLIVLDVMLGDLDGRDICRALKQHHVIKSIPLVMISAGVSIQSMKQTGCNAEEYISKPFDIDDLLGKVSRLL